MTAQLDGRAGVVLAHPQVSSALAVALMDVQKVRFATQARDSAQLRNQNVTHVSTTGSAAPAVHVTVLALASEYAYLVALAVPNALETQHAWTTPTRDTRSVNHKVRAAASTQIQLTVPIPVTSAIQPAAEALRSVS